MINSEDKEPSWDGALYVYKTPGNNHKKSDLLKCVPVQIKGCKKKSVCRKEIKYSVDVSDLRNFLKEGGAIFFVVYFDENGENEHIYYRNLLPYDLRVILNGLKNSKTKSIALKPFPTDKSEVTDIVINFANHMIKQSSLYSLPELYSYEELCEKGEIAELNIIVSSAKPINDPIKYLLNHETYVYAKTNLGFSIPIDHIEKIALAVEHRTGKVTVNNNVFYENYKVRHEKDRVSIIIGNSFVLSFQTTIKKCNFNFKLKGTLSERITDGQFFINLIRYGELHIDDKPFPYFNSEIFKDFDLESFKGTINGLIQAKETLDSFNVKVDLDFDNLNEDDLRLLNLLISAHNGKEITLNDVGRPFGIYRIGTLKILIGAEKNIDTGKYKVVNFFDSSYKLFVDEDNGNRQLLPLFVGLRKEDIVECCNFDSDLLLQQLNNEEWSEFKSGYITLWLLELIKACDLKRNDNFELLHTAEAFVSAIKAKDNYITPAILRLNELQIAIRKRELNTLEKEELQHIVKSNRGNLEIKIGAYILLGAYTEARLLLSELDKEHQEIFCGYPIYNILLNNQQMIDIKDTP